MFVHEQNDEKKQKADFFAPAGRIPLFPSQRTKTDYSPRVIQRKHHGLPDRLKLGVEALSGLPMDDVQVHFNSPKPARLQAYAYTQGNQIHVGPGQEKHLPHEAWHVVQQKLGRVKPTLQLGNLAVNDAPHLEMEANQMGRRADRFQLPSRLKRIESEPAQAKDRFQYAQVRSEPSGARKSNILQRLPFDKTDWRSANKAWASSGSGQGVVFLQDRRGPALLIKASQGNEVESVLAYNLISETLKDDKASIDNWTIGAPQVRIASPDEAATITARIDRLIPRPSEEEGRAIQTLKAPGAVLLVMSAVSGVEAMKQIGSREPINRTQVKHTKPGSNNDREERDTFLTRLWNEPAVLKLLGKAAAIDIFLGNDDRLIKAINTKNWMVDMESRALHLIDNVSRSESALFHSADWASPEQAFRRWATTQNRLEPQQLAQDSFRAIATTVIDALINDIKRESNLRPIEQEMIENKLDQARNSMIVWFMHGLWQGKLHLAESTLKFGALLRNIPRDNNRLYEVTVQVWARRLFLFGGEHTKANADRSWEQAVVTAAPVNIGNN